MPTHQNRPLCLTREQVRNVDRIAIQDFGMQGTVLMENAGRNAAELLQSLGIQGRVVICCGKGNNGGDGFVIARHLENAGIDVQVLLAVPPDSITGDAKINLQIIQKGGTPISVLPGDWAAEFSDIDWIVDALLGTGTEGTIRDPYPTVIEAINGSGCKVLAVDLPSGMDCDTGLPLGHCVQAIHTATFVASKPGFSLPAARRLTGEVHVLDIGVPRLLFTKIG